jgi:NAD(P)-dependent dehydrogenase (short-subunit alcohol dehydrogenase family)
LSGHASDAFVLQSSTGKSSSADGLELSFATNTLGAYHLTRLLEPVLKRSAPSRVVFVSSGGMYIGAARKDCSRLTTTAVCAPKHS